MKEVQKLKQKFKKKFSKNMILRLKNKNNHINKILTNIMIKNKEDTMIEKAMMMEAEIIDRKRIKSNNISRKIQTEEMTKLITIKVDLTEMVKESIEEAIITINKIRILKISRKTTNKFKGKKIIEKKLKRKK
jgi:hypothetical protein